MIDTDSPQFRALLKLSGMAYNSCESREHWKEITGLDPAYAGSYYVTIHPSGRCSLTDAARNHLHCYYAARRQWSNMMTGRSFLTTAEQ
jgi:hypothetical protein